MSNQNTVIETKHLSKKGGTGYRVKDLNLSVPEHSVYGFLGPNGAGKTTTLKLLLGLIQPSEGSICLLNESVTPANQLRLNRNTGSLIESPSYYAHLTGAENLEIIARYKGLPVKEAEEALQITGIYERKDQKVREYSLGMKQRLGLSMAILGKPKILILDEPTNGLDPAGIQEIRTLIKNMPRMFQTTVLVSSHLLSEIDQMADYVGIINKGELIYQGALRELEKSGQSLETIFLSMTEGERFR